MTPARPTTRPWLRILGPLAALSLLAAGCSDDDDAGADDPAGADEDGSGAGGDAPTADLTIAFPAEPGFSDTPLLVTIDELNEAGWGIETVVINDTGLQTEALVTGDVQMTASNANPALQAIESGIELVMLGERSLNDWIVVADEGFEDCDALDGETIGYHSEASPSTFMLRTWLEEECPDSEPEMLIMEGSANRAAALVDGQIAATIVQVEDWTTATADGADGVHILAHLDETLTDLITSAYVTTADWAEENADALTLFFETLLGHNQEYEEDPDALAAAAVEQLEAADEATIDLIIDAYGGSPFFADGGLTEERVAYTLDFLLDAEVITSELDPAAVTDRTALDAALEELGG